MDYIVAKKQLVFKDNMLTQVNISFFQRYQTALYIKKQRLKIRFTENVSFLD